MVLLLTCSFGNSLSKSISFPEDFTIFSKGVSLRKWLPITASAPRVGGELIEGRVDINRGEGSY